MIRRIGASASRLAAWSWAVVMACILPSHGALAAEATPATGGDPRSPGEGPGFVGDPLFAIGAVLAIGLATLVLTVVYVRLTDGRRGRRDRE